MANNPQPDNIQDDQLMSDLLRNAKLSSLQFEEPEVTTFDMQSVFQDSSLSTRSLGKRVSKPKQEEVITPPSSFFNSTTQNVEAQSASLNQGTNYTSTNSASASTKSDSPTTPSSQCTQPKTFAQLLHSSLYHDEGQEPKELDPNYSFFDGSKTTTTSAQDLVQAAMNLQEQQEPVKPKESKVQKLFEDENNEEAVYDPSASLVDDYHYDEYEDKKRFSTTDYKKVEEYLANESLNGFHFSRNDGKKYYFYKGRPHQYYYKVLYFTKVPDQAYWDNLAHHGWQLIDQSPSRHKKDAGWYIVRNEMHPGELPQDIDNDEEKRHYFARLASSCRSTLLLLFIVMVCCAVAIWLQYQFKGYLAVIIASAVLFAITLWTFLIYLRMLTKARKQAALLSARMRLAQDDQYQALQVNQASSKN